MKNTLSSTPRWLTLALLSSAMLAALPACVPLMIGGAVVGGTLVATDRRTSGAQLEDEGIELRSAARVSEALGERAHVNITSFNRQVLVTGEAQTEQDKQKVADIVAKVDNVRSVVNELGVMGNATLTQRSSDTIVTSRVKAAMVDASDLQVNAFKVVTERGTVHLMGRVTQREANRATEVVRGVSGVQRVVRSLEIVTEEELARIAPKPAAK
jgi:osmotically-inducible protein OsmY